MSTKKILTVKSLILVFSVFSLLLISSCTKEEKEQAKSMEQIRQEEGIPIKSQEITTTSFSKKLSFFATLSGIKESTVTGAVPDKVNKIHFKVGDAVKENQIVLEFPTNNPSLQFDQAKAGYENAKKLYNRMQELVKAGETSQINLDNAETQYLVAKRNYESLKQLLFVEAPISGVITELLAREGDYIGMGTKLFTVAQLNIIKAKIWVSQQEINQIRLGMTATINISGVEYKGRVNEIALSMDDKMRAFGVEIHFNNSNRALKSGVTTDLTIQTYQKENAIVIQRNLVQTEGDKKFVYLENNGKAEKRYIQTGLEEGIDVEVLDGLKSGEKIIVQGMTLVSDGSKVKLIN